MKGLTGREIGRVASGAYSGEDLFAKTVQRIALHTSRHTPFDKLMFSQSNARRIKAGVYVDDPAEAVDHRGQLQNFSIRLVSHGDGTEGKFEIPAWGRRYQALSLLVKQKHLAETTPIPCIVRDAGSAILPEDDSLAENMQHVAQHPLDQFRAGTILRDKCQSDGEVEPPSS